MTDNAPTLETSRKLYDVITRVHDLAPWQWMEETDMFGLQNPDTSEYGFISVMGMAGEHYAIALYLGAEGLYGFRELEENAPDFPPEQLLQIPQLQASFEDRKELRKQDLDILKSLGLKFRGKHAWPMFRSYRPGYMPWFVDAAEANFLFYALEQLLDVAPRFKKNPALFGQEGPEKYLMRIPHQKDGIRVWNDQGKRFLRPSPVMLSIATNEALLKRAQKLPKSKGVIEIDFFMFPSPVQEERGGRPFFPYMMLVADSKSGAILGTELLHPDPTLESMWGKIPLKVLEQLARINVLPQEIRVRAPLLIQLLPHLAKDLGIKLKQVDRLPAADTARQFMQGFGLMDF